ncbi:MAG: DUF2892 domain-containing protein, partial [Bacteroidetes bacterium]|nr:DUF2892 domain-containing protein [Bacteroidota bacterium]
MKRNVGDRDIVIRVFAAGVIAFLYGLSVVTGAVGVILMIVALVLLATA